MPEEKTQTVHVMIEVIADNESDACNMIDQILDANIYINDFTITNK